MDITVTASELVKELSVVAQATSRKQTIPILSNVLMTAEFGNVGLVATDLEIGLTATCPAEVAEIGKATIPAAKLLEMVKSLPGDTKVRLAVDKKGKGVTLEGGTFVAKLQAMPADEFPVLAVPPEAWIKLPRAALAASLVRTRYATSLDDKRYMLNGVSIELSADGFVAVGTDGHRLAKADVSCKTEADEPSQIILPTRTIEALLDMLQSETDEVEYAAGENNLFFRTGERLLISRMVDGKFPPYKKMIPAASETPATAGRVQFLDAVRRARMVMDKEGHKITFTLSKNKMDLAAESVAIGTAAESVAIDYTGPDMAIGLQGRYVEAFLSACESEKVIMEVSDPNKPGMFREDGGPADYMCLIMSMR